MRTAPDQLIETHLIGANTREVLVYTERCPALAAAGIRLCGVSEVTAPYRMVRLRLDFSEVLAVLGGLGRVWVDGDWRELRAGEIYLAPRGAVQAFYPVPGRSWRIAWVHYHDDVAAGERVIAGEMCRVSAGDCEPLGTAVLALHNELSGEADAELLAHLSTWVDLAARRLARTDAVPQTRLRALARAGERVDGGGDGKEDRRGRRAVAADLPGSARDEPDGLRNAVAHRARGDPAESDADESGDDRRRGGLRECVCVLRGVSARARGASVGLPAGGWVTVEGGAR